jgi:hypothetical protein
MAVSSGMDSTQVSFKRFSNASLTNFEYHFTSSLFTILAVGMSCDPAKLLLLGSGNLLIKDLIGVCRDRCDHWRVGHIKGMCYDKKCCFAVLAIECFTNRPLSVLLILVLSSNAKSLHLLGCLISDYHLLVAVVWGPSAASGGPTKGPDYKLDALHRQVAKLVVVSSSTTVSVSDGKA